MKHKSQILISCLFALLAACPASADQNPTILGEPMAKITPILGPIGQASERKGLFNTEVMYLWNGNLNWPAYHTAVGFRKKPAGTNETEPSLFIILQKRNGAAINSTEVEGLLYLCANDAKWSEGKPEDETSKPNTGYKYQEVNAGVIGRTYIAYLRKQHRQLVIYAPDWMPNLGEDFGIKSNETDPEAGQSLDTIYELLDNSPKESGGTPQKEKTPQPQQNPSPLDSDPTTNPTLKKKSPMPRRILGKANRRS